MRSFRRGPGWLSWPVKVFLLLIGAMAGFLDHAFAGWGVPIFVAVGTLVISVFYWREFWNQMWFWITMGLLAIVQVPLIIAMRPLIGQPRVFYLAVFLMADLIFVAAVIIYMPKIEQKD
jgi:hypothetical protein